MTLEKNNYFLLTKEKCLSEEILLASEAFSQSTITSDCYCITTICVFYVFLQKKKKIQEHFSLLNTEQFDTSEVQKQLSKNNFS